MSLEVYPDPLIKPRIAPMPEPASRVLLRDSEGPGAAGHQLAMAGQGADDPNPLSPTVEKGAADQHEELTFDDFLDIINPLHHIPVLSAAYREITGDEISPYARTLGGFLYTGPIGLVGGAVNGIVEEATGKDLGASFLALFQEDADSGPLPGAAGATTEPLDPDGAGFGGNDRVFPQGDPEEDVPLWSALPPRESLQAQESNTTKPSHTPDQNVMTGDEALKAYLSDMSRLSEAMYTRTSEAGPEAPAEPQSAETTTSRRDSASKFYSLEGVVRARTVSASPSLNAKHSEDVTSREREGTEIAPSHQSGAGIGSAATLSTEGEASVADRMMQALEKYEAMVRRRNGESGASNI